MKGFVFVGLAGFLAGIFLAPKKGSELRGQISERMDNLKASAQEKSNQLKDAVMPVISQVKEESCNLRNEGKEIVQDVNACLDKNMENGQWKAHPFKWILSQSGPAKDKCDTLFEWVKTR